MKPRLLLLPCLLCLVGTPAPASAQKAAATREVAEFLLKKFGKEAAGESVESLTAKVAQVSAKYGDEGVTAIRKVGPRAFGVIEDAGNHGVGVVKLMAKHGDEAVWVVSKSKGMAIFIRYGAEGAEALMKHKGIGEGFIEATGQSGVKALNAVNPANGRKLANLVEDGVIVPGGESARLLDVIEKYGDRAAEFIWRHKGALTVGTALAAFAADPEPFIDGAVSLPHALIKEAAPRVDWTLVLVLGMVMVGAWLWYTGRIRRKNPNPSGR